MNREVDITELKKFAKEEFDSFQIMKEFILDEPDFIPIEEFILKCKIWLQLLGKCVKLQKWGRI